MARQAEIVEATNQLLIPNYGRLPMAIARGRGARVWDADGREYLDFFPGFGACGVGGHCHPKIVSAIRDQAERVLACGNLFIGHLGRQFQRLAALGIMNRPAGGPLDGFYALAELGGDLSIVFLFDCVLFPLEPYAFFIAHVGAPAELLSVYDHALPTTGDRQ